MVYNSSLAICTESFSNCTFPPLTFSELPTSVQDAQAVGVSLISNIKLAPCDIWLCLITGREPFSPDVGTPSTVSDLIYCFVGAPVAVMIRGRGALGRRIVTLSKNGLFAI